MDWPQALSSGKCDPVNDNELALRFIIKHLKPRQQAVVLRRFGFETGAPMKFREIGEEIGQDTRNAYRYYKKAILKIRTILQNHNALLNHLQNMCLAFFFVLLTTRVFASNITLEWDPNTERDLAGHNLYSSTNTLLEISTQAATVNQFVNKLRVGTSVQISTATQMTVSLPPNTTMHYRLTLHDTWYNESGFNVDYSSNPAEVVIFLKNGDLNGDGKIDAGDIINTINMILGNTPVDLDADFNGDKIVTVVDVSILINIVLNSP